MASTKTGEGVPYVLGETKGNSLNLELEVEKVGRPLRLVR